MSVRRAFGYAEESEGGEKKKFRGKGEKTSLSAPRPERKKGGRGRKGRKKGSCFPLCQPRTSVIGLTGKKKKKRRPQGKKGNFIYSWLYLAKGGGKKRKNKKEKKGKERKSMLPILPPISSIPRLILQRKRKGRKEKKRGAF